MSEAIVLLIITVVVATLSVVGLVACWIKKRRARGIQLFGLGVTVVGLYLSGLLALLWHGLQALGSWLRTASGEAVSLIGIAVAALGLILLVLAGIRAGQRPRSDADQRPDEKRRRGRATGQPGKTGQRSTDRGATRPGSLPPSPHSGGPAGQASGDADLDEVEQILKSRGIE